MHFLHVKGSKASEPAKKDLPNPVYQAVQNPNYQAAVPQKPAVQNPNYQAGVPQNPAVQKFESYADAGYDSSWDANNGNYKSDSGPVTPLGTTTGNTK